MLFEIYAIYLFSFKWFHVFLIFLLSNYFHLDYIRISLVLEIYWINLCNSSSRNLGCDTKIVVIRINRESTKMLVMYYYGIKLQIQAIRQGPFSKYKRETKDVEKLWNTWHVTERFWKINELDSNADKIEISKIKHTDIFKIFKTLYTTRSLMVTYWKAGH